MKAPKRQVTVIVEQDEGTTVFSFVEPSDFDVDVKHQERELDWGRSAAYKVPFDLLGPMRVKLDIETREYTVCWVPK